MDRAARALAVANGKPKTAPVRMYISGSMIGELIQNAITGARGTPAPRRPAMIGITPHEQNGDRAPKAAAVAIMATGRPPKIRAICWSAPLARALAATTTEKARNGAM